ncbi:maltose/maltodextrin transport ATP-binding protein malK [Vibrio sp. JCM 19236]|nr:maltose/maltodextrin transport ATP-binding protein malK [Vibrio sp. JCM 19236]
MTSVTLKNVYKSYGDVQISKDVNLDIKEGEFVVFVGPSGCGKSTLLRCIAGLEDITSGDLYIGEERMNDVEPSKRGVGMVFQSYALYPHLNLYDNMSFGMKLAKADKGETDRRVKHAADILQLTHLLDRQPKALSGGQRQRVAIGRTLVSQPNVFLLDEPLSNLDAALRVQMRSEITKLQRQLGCTMIYVTHDQVEAMTMADKIVVLDGGYVSQVGKPLELYHYPKNRFVAGFIGSPKMNFISVHIKEATAETYV